MYEVNKDRIVSTLRALLISSMGGINVLKIKDYYYEVTGEILPISELGFESVNKFLHSIPSIVVEKKGLDFVASALPINESKHVAELVNQQRPTFACRSNYKFNAKEVKNAEASSVGHTIETKGKFNEEPSFCKKKNFPIKSAKTVCAMTHENEAPRCYIDKTELKYTRRKDRGMTCTQAHPIASEGSFCEELIKQLGSSKQDPGDWNCVKQGPEPIITGSHTHKLISFFEEKMLPLPMYYIFTKGTGSRKAVCLSFVSVRCLGLPFGDQNLLYSSLSKRCYDVHSAKESASKKALDGLKIINGALFVESKSIDSTDDCIRRRILNIINKVNADVWHHQIEEIYGSTYGEQLPDNWESILDKVPIVPESLAGTKVIRKLPTQIRVNIYEYLLKGSEPYNWRYQRGRGQNQFKD